MRLKRSLICATVLSVLGFALGFGHLQAASTAISSRPVVPDCDRACLKSFADRYFVALLSHSPAHLPLDAHVRMTENTIAIPVGEGVLWRALSNVPDTLRIDVIDVTSQQIAVGGLAEVAGRPYLTGLRLKIKNRAIVEIEQLFSDMIQPVALPNLEQPRAHC